MASIDWFLWSCMTILLGIIACIVFAAFVVCSIYWQQTLTILAVASVAGLGVRGLLYLLSLLDGYLATRCRQ